MAIAPGSGRPVALTAVLGCTALAADGRRLGRVTDLTVDITHNPAPVMQVRVGRGRGARYVPFAGLSAQATAGTWTVLTGAPVTRRRGGAGDRELGLAADVLDVQVVDVDGRRVARVSEVLLRLAGRDLELTGVDVGVRGLARRLARRPPDPEPVTAVPFGRLHLTSSRGHQLQLDTPWAAVHRTDPGQLAHLLRRLTPSQSTDVVRAVGPRRAAVALLDAQAHEALAVMRGLPPLLADQVRRHLPPDSARTHPHLHDDRVRPRRTRRLAGWRRGRPDERSERS